MDVKLPGMVDRLAQEIKERRLGSTSRGSGGNGRGIKHPTFEFAPIHYSINDPNEHVIKCHCPECDEERQTAEKKVDALAIFEAVLQQKKELKKQMMQRVQRP